MIKIEKDKNKERGRDSETDIVRRQEKEREIDRE